ncbi:radial spoke head protein 9 homolog isoform X4 [Stegastes partitus]|uniref:Radial spoke head protein 9 homolog n=1 Tax=Stegastes partitus TaxID=144197 RepID=A0A9Y4N9G3_9TELE|nr:PREDICTED: radial spoke head protein 9 homolog isoform X4 [Stegastes partitus]
MDADSLFFSLDAVAGSGNTLSPEQRAALQSSLLVLRRSYKFRRVLFWGKVLGLKQDYFIAQGRGEDELRDRKYLYSLNCIDWFLLPPATDSTVAQVSGAARGQFVGDPSFVYERVESPRMSEDEAAQSHVNKVNEETRLSVTVHQIDQDVSVVPRGAFIRNHHGLVHVNRSFAGLSESEAKKLDSFLHLSEAKNPKNPKPRSVLQNGELNPAMDFLDVLSDDVPKGSWSLQFESAGRVCILRSLLWLGLTFYHLPGTPQHGYVYIGDGTKHLDLPFML